METRSVNVAWQEGEFKEQPARDENGNVLIVIAVASASYPDGYPVYVPDDEATKIKSVVDVQSALGKPA